MAEVAGHLSLAELQVGYRTSGDAKLARHYQVIWLLAQGRTNRQIGAELYISEKTASVHVSNILAKFGAASRAEAVAIAAAKGLLARVD